ncbi:DUF6526 family protein [Paenibacillus chartarius]|uniref:DUF6526 family protein n=1 Tax=Paenibacillus chartarius TaxID=747481 RepID=A0ABV6DN84_9BACL
MANVPQNQEYSNHRRLDPLYHMAAAPLSLIIFIGTLVNLIVQSAQGSFTFQTLLLFLIGFTLLNIGALTRLYGNKVQDRAIRAETNLRHYILTSKPLDRRLTIKQIVALRFAGDDELPALAARAAESAMKPDDIKKAIRNWQPDFDRV